MSRQRIDALEDSSPRVEVGLDFGLRGAPTSKTRHAEVSTESPRAACFLPGSRGQISDDILPDAWKVVLSAQPPAQLRNRRSPYLPLPGGGEDGMLRRRRPGGMRKRAHR